MKEDPDWLNLAFTYVRQWREIDFNSHRKVWMEAFGVPLHAWCPQFFKRLGNQLGKVIEIDADTVDKKDLRSGKFLVETPILQDWTGQ